MVHDLKVKAKAIQLVLDKGESAATVARDIGVPASTVRTWVQRHSGRMPTGHPWWAPPESPEEPETELEEIEQEITGTKVALYRCEEAGSWQAAAAHRRLLRQLRTHRRELLQSPEEECATDESVAAVIQQILMAQAAVRRRIWEHYQSQPDPEEYATDGEPKWV